MLDQTNLDTLEEAEEDYLSSKGWKPTVATDVYQVSDAVCALLGQHPSALWHKHEALALQRILDRNMHRTHEGMHDAKLRES